MAVAAGPTIPASEDKKGARVNLDQPPPLPSSMRTPDVSGLAGTMSQNQQGTPPAGDLASTVAQQAMLVEKVVGSLAQMLPGFMPMASQIISLLRSGVVSALQQSQNAQNGPGAGAPAGSPGGMMSSGPPQQPPMGMGMG